MRPSLVDDAPPNLGAKCACCDVETPLRRKYNPGRGTRRLSTAGASPLALPICKACDSEGHLYDPSGIAPVAIGIAGVLGLAIGLSNHMLAVTILSLAALARAGLLAVLARTKLNAHAARGHHVGLQLMLLPGMISLRTTNPRFADDVRAQNPKLTS